MNIYFSQPDLLKPPISRAAYSDRTAWIMAECSRLAYEDFKKPEQLKKLAYEGGFHPLKTFDESDTQAILLESDRYLVLAFRGTEKNFEDIKTDLKIRFIKTDAGKVHKGFQTAYMTIHGQLIEALANISKPIYITGHSLGGALASIATWQLKRDNLAACYTFGAPHIGSEEFEFKANKIPLYRVVNSADIVPRLLKYHPGYHHPGSHFFLTEDAALIRSPGGLQKTKYFFTGFFRRFGKNAYLDHKISEYSEKLRKIAVSRN